MAAIYSNGGNRWNILGFNFTKRDALSSVYKISMGTLKVEVYPSSLLHILCQCMFIPEKSRYHQTFDKSLQEFS
jgi:hypothetical protein